MTAKRILLTGGNGFIAVHTIILLLDRGYNVTTTVRSENKTTYLRQKFSAAVGTGQLKFVIVEDMTPPGAFDTALTADSFDAVIHMSSPVILASDNIKKDILLPAIQGTTELLKSTKAHAPTVKRVVINSSIAALALEESETNPFLGYVGSKIYSERAAWEFIDIEKPGFDLVVLCPTQVFGPIAQEVTSMSNINTSSNIFYPIFSGEQKEPNNAIFWQWVDVRDVAEANVAAMEKSNAGGQRFVVAAGDFNIGLVVDYTWKHFPERALAKGIPKDTSKVQYPEGGHYAVDNTPSKRILGLQYRSFEDSLKDQLDRFVALEKEIGSRID